MGLGPDFEARVSQLRAAYLGNLPARAREFAAGVAALRAGDPGLSREHRLSLRMVVHRLRGSAALYGLSTLVEWATRTETLCHTGSAEVLLSASAELDRLAAELVPSSLA